MSLSRRELLGWGTLATAATLSGCARVANRFGSPEVPNELRPPQQPSRSRRLAERVGFGARPGDLAALEVIGAEAWIARQLAANDEDPATLRFQLSRIDALRIEGTELRDQPQESTIQQIQRATLLRATLSPNQLKERMADFWVNHLNIYARKGLAAYRLGADVERVVRPHVLGSFPDLIRASAKSPAMLAYLDNTRNTRQGPNENYARELMELHTMGVDGGYTYRDIREVARCFTGWTLENRFLRARGRLVFNPRLHDDGEKVVLGTRIPAGGGEGDAARAVDIILAHPACSRFIAGKLGEHFLGTRTGPAVDQAERAFRESEGNIRATLGPILDPDALTDAPPLIKRPVDYVVSSLRAVAAETDGGPPLMRHLAAMGQPLHEWPMPDGFPTDTAAWSGSMLARWNFAHALVTGGIGGTQVALDRLSGRGEGATLAGVVPLSEEARDPDPAMQATLALCQPDFMWR